MDGSRNVGESNIRVKPTKADYSYMQDYRILRPSDRPLVDNGHLQDVGFAQDTNEARVGS